MAGVQRSLRDRNNIVGRSKTTSNLARKRTRKAACSRVEQALSLWDNQRRKNGGRVTRKMILEKAKKLADDMGVDFKPNADWLHEWQRKKGKAVKKPRGHSSDDSHEEEPVTNYEPSDIFYAKETAFFVRLMPQPRFPDYTGCKERLTVLFFCNAIGTYKKAIVIGKPHCFKSNPIPLQYITQSNASMTQEIWSDVLASFDAEMAEAGRQIKLYVDNTPVHRKYGTLKNVNLQFLPPKDKSVAQPLDQDIIDSFTKHYRTTVLRKQISVIKSGRPIQDFVKEFGIPDVVHYINMAWQLVQPDLIVSCFQKANLIPGDEYFPLESFGKGLLKYILNQMGVEEWNRFVDCDKDLPCHSGDEMVIDDNPVVVDDTEGRRKKKKKEKGTKDANRIVSKEDALKALNILRRNFLPDDELSSGLDEIERLIIMNMPSKKFVQKLITDSFKPIR